MTDEEKNKLAELERRVEELDRHATFLSDELEKARSFGKLVSEENRRLQNQIFAVERTRLGRDHVLFRLDVQQFFSFDGERRDGLIRHAVIDAVRSILFNASRESYLQELADRKSL